jgi:hypothetical protein
LPIGQWLIKVDSPSQNLKTSGKPLMQFGFLKFLLLGILIIALGGFAYLALVDVPVQQKEIAVDVPLNTQ